MPPLRETLRDAPLPAERLLAFGLALGEFLSERHALGEVTGQLCLSGLEQQDDGTLALADGHFSAEQLEAEGALPPEGWDEGDEPRIVATARAEVWQAGVVLYLAATGEHPFDEEDPELRRDQVQHVHPALPGSLRPEIPLEWDPIVSCCLHKGAKERFADGLDLEREIQALAASGGTARREPRVLRPLRIALATFVLTALLMVAWLWLRG